MKPVFNLLEKTESTSFHWTPQSSTLEVKLDCKIKPVLSNDWDEENYQKTEKTCKDVEDHVRSKLPQEEWKLVAKYGFISFDSDVDSEEGIQKIYLDSVVVAGDFLDALNSYQWKDDDGTPKPGNNSSAFVLETEFRINDSYGAVPADPAMHIHVDGLYPLMLEDGNFDNRIYVCLDFGRCEMFTSSHGWSWKISKISLQVNPNKLASSTYHGKGITREQLAAGIDSYVQFICAGGTVPCHESVLMGQSSVLDYVDLAETTGRKIFLRDRSVTVVKQFLAYLYHRNSDVAGGLPSVAVSVYELANIFKVVDLIRFMRELILSKPNNWFTANAALNLFEFARMVNDEEVKTKAIKALKSTGDGDLQAATSFSKIFPTSQAKELFLRSRIKKKKKPQDHPYIRKMHDKKLQ